MKGVELAGKEETMSNKRKREMKQKKVEQGRENRKDYGKLGREGTKSIKTRNNWGSGDTEKHRRALELTK